MDFDHENDTTSSGAWMRARGRKRLRAPRVCATRCGQWVAYRYAVLQLVEDEHVLQDGLLRVLFELRCAVCDPPSASTLRRMRSTLATLAAVSAAPSRRNVIQAISAHAGRHAQGASGACADMSAACMELQKEAAVLHRHALALLDESEAGERGCLGDLRIVVEHYRLVLGRIMSHEDALLDTAESTLTPADWRQIEAELPLQLPTYRRGRGGSSVDQSASREVTR